MDGGGNALRLAEMGRGVKGIVSLRRFGVAGLATRSKTDGNRLRFGDFQLTAAPN